MTQKHTGATTTGAGRDQIQAEPALAGRQDGGANIWSAVLAGRWRVVRCGIGWPGPEVLLSLLLPANLTL